MKQLTAFLLLLLLMMPLGVSAEEAETGEDVLRYMGLVDEFHRYEFSDGRGFYTTLKNGETDALVAAFSFDEGISRAFTREGEAYLYEEGGVIQEAGLYQVVIFHSGLMESALFTFSVSTAAESGAELPDLAGMLQELFAGKQEANVPLTGGYDPEMQRYTYAFPDGAAFSATIPNGAIGSRAALYFTAGITVECWYEGEKTAYESGSVCTRPGAYHFVLYHRGRGEDGGETAYTAAYYALLLDGPSNAVDVVNAPADFCILSVMREGEAVQPENAHTLRLRQDGAYFITFVSDFFPQQYYNVRLERDTRAPLLYFTEGALSGALDQPVAYSPSEPDCFLEVTMNYDPYPVTGWLADNGSYQLRIRDTAGNVRSYYITVDVPVAVGMGTVAWILTGAVLAAVILWMLHLRRKSRTI